MGPDRIELTGIRATGTIGVLPEEQSRAQPFEIDIIISLDASAAGESDDLTDTVNYAEAITLAVKVVESEPTLLLERVASRIAAEVLELPLADTAEVVIRKLRPPVPEDIVSTAVRVKRSKIDLVRPKHGSTTAYIGLGSNLGDRHEYLRFALRHLPGLVAVSNLYETDPVGGPAQDSYLNAVAKLETTEDPFTLLDTCLAIELAAGRERTVRWGPRTLDLDVLLWGDATISSPRLTVPHPRINERRFVLQPLSDIDPDLLAPGWETAVGGQVLKKLDEALELPL